MKNKPARTIKVDYLARVEGEGSLIVKMKDGQVNDVKFRIFEPPRFFEAFLRGRKYSEAPDITARICGICPIAYQMSSVHAMENAFGVRVDGQLRELRRLLYCGEWIESHALHVYMLHAPDFLGYEDAIQLAKDHPDAVQRGLRLKKTGNDLVTILAGREIHPINVKVGGFYKLPAKKDFLEILERLKRARDEAYETVLWTASLPFPSFECDYEFVSLSHPDEYPFNEGRLVSNKGLNIDIREYELVFHETHASYTNALQSEMKGKGAYFVGPLARYNLNFDKLSPLARKAAREANAEPPISNPFKSIVARAVETLYACDEAIRIIENYEQPEKPAIEYSVQPGFGFGCTEAPRGILYHRYMVGEDGAIKDAKIVPPTSQNQKMIEADLRSFVTANIEMPKQELTLRCEQVVRNYDPCISCATHFLKLEIS
ncbi:MAG: Ni/Fe hydrogenase subunit alpha [Bacteroidetes bacterium]|nr:Ni/Fe hydrogenase subunit alpha [Bacteroidota bacterium]